MSKLLEELFELVEKLFNDYYEALNVLRELRDGHTIEWVSVEDNMPPMPEHAQDPCSERVLVYMKKEYYPHITFGSYDYEGSFWYLDRSGDEEVTHWAKEPAPPQH